MGLSIICVYCEKPLVDADHARKHVVEQCEKSPAAATRKQIAALTVVVELAAREGCKQRFEDELCQAADCLHCRAAALLPELKCKCGMFVLDRACPSMWDARTQPAFNHAPEECAPPVKPTHCTSCKQPLPKETPCP